MDVINYNSPIIIPSDDEDDDDVVLVKEEKATQDAGANDDVIFVSAESSPSLQKYKSEIHKRNNKKDLAPSSSSAFDTNVDFNISHVNVQIFNSALFSLDSIDRIFQPLDSTESLLLGTDASSQSTDTNVTIVDQLQASVSQQEVNTVVDAKICPGNSHDKLPQSSGKSSLSCAFQENSLLQTTTRTLHDTSTVIQEVDINGLCIDRTVALNSDVLASTSNDSVETPVPGHLQQSTSPVMTYTSERDPVPGTSNHSSNSSFDCSVSPLDDLKFCIPEKTTSSSNSNSPLPLDVDIFSAEGLINLFNFFDNPQSEKDLKSCCKNVNATEDSDMKGNKISKLVGSDDVTHRILPSVKASAVTENSVSLKPTSQDHHNVTNCDKQVKCNVETLSSDGISLDYFHKVTHKSPMSRCKLLSPDKLSTAKYNHPSRVPGLINNDNSSNLQSKSLFSGHAPVTIPNVSKTNPYRRRAVLNWLGLAQTKKHNLNHCMKRSDSLVQTYLQKISRKSLSQDLDTKAPMTSAAHWKIVSSESSRKKRAHFDIMNDEQPKRKQQQLETVEEKPDLKIKLKMISPTSGSVSHSKLSTSCSPCNIGLKKSIIRRQASLLGAAVETMKGVQPTVHRSVSESNMKGGQEERDTQMLCATCCKTVSSKKLAKCCKGHDICATCLEPQVKVILTGDVKQKNVKCPTDMCTEALSFDELRKTLPSFVVDILEKKLDKEYLSYITKWMFTDEQLKTRSEFATLDTKITPAPTVSMRKYEEIYSQESCDIAADLPAFWAPMEHGAPVMAFEVVPDTEAYREIACQFYETCPFGDYDIARIIRVQNPILWKYFALKQSEMIQENDGIDVVVKQLYHGTHHSTLEAIARKGFDWRLSGKHGTVYGNGSYFARTAHYSHAYTDSAGSGVSVKAGGRPSYMFQSSTSSLSHYSNNPLRYQASLWSTFPTLQSLNPIFLSSSQSPQTAPVSRGTYTTPALQHQAQPMQLTVKDAACGPAPSTSRSSLLSSQKAAFPGLSSVKYTSFNCSSSSFSTAASPQNQSSNYSSCFRNPTGSTSVFEHLQPSSLPALSLWDTLEDALMDKTYDQIKSDPENHIARCSGSATVPQCKEKGTSNLTSAFARDPNSKTHFMFVAKVLVGRHTGGKSGLKRPPPLDDSNPYGKCYDSCVDNIFSPQVYVIFDSNQAYPEYIIEYNWHKS